MPKKFFISYRSVEREFALKIAQDLTEAGYSIWMDRLGGILPGDNWSKALQEGVTECRAFLACLSPNYIDSTWCKRELERADALRKPIFPLLIGEVSDTLWPITIQEKQYTDFKNWEVQSSYDKAFAELLTGFQKRLDVVPGEVVTLPPLGALNLDRDDPEDKAEQAINEANIPIVDDFAKIEAEEIAKDIAQLLKEYRATAADRRKTIASAVRSRFELAMEEQKTQIETLKAKLEEITRGSRMN